MQTIIVLIIVAVAAIYVGFFIYRRITRMGNGCKNAENGCEDCDLCQDVNTCKIKDIKKQMRERKNPHK